MIRIGLPFAKGSKSRTVKNGLVAEYRMTETSGQTLWNSKKESKAVTNLVQNGDFSQGTSGWSGTNLSIVGGIAQGLVGQQYATIANQISNVINGHKYYGYADVKCDVGANLTLALQDRVVFSAFANIGFTATGNFQRISCIGTVNTSNSPVWFHVFDNRTSGWTPVYCDNFCLIDLTTLFGAGNEPTKEQCDYLFSQWHDGTRMMDLPMYNGQLGSTTGTDTNDPTFDGKGLVFSTDDYVKLPYMINAEHDFTVYVVANVGAVAPSANEYYFSFGTPSNIIPYGGLSRRTDGILKFRLANNAGVVGGDADLVSTPGINLFVIKSKAGIYTLKNMTTGIVSNNANIPALPITFSQSALGALCQNTYNSYSNQPQYFVSFYQRATTDAEDQQELRAVRRELAKRGVVLGSKNEFYADYVGKVAGSEVENPNTAKYGYGSSLIMPNGIWVGESSYPKIINLDGSLSDPYTFGNGLSAQSLYSFNIIRNIEDQIKGKIPGNTLAEKIAWCKDNCNMSVRWFGRGTSPNGNKAYLQVWNPLGSWVGSANHINGTITQLSYTDLSINPYIDATGFLHLISYTDPSNGVTASTIYTDTCNLLIKLKAGVVLV